MKEEWRELFLRWSETEAFAEKLRNAHRRLEEAKRLCRRPAVLYSGGKDSTVGVHLTLQHFPEVLIFHYDYTFNIPRPIAAEILENLRKLGAKNIIVAREEKPVPDDRGFFSAVNRFIRECEVDCIFSCLRAEESKRRKALTASDGRFQGARNIHIIKDWTWKDVWAYIVSKNLPYVSVYDKYAEVEGWDKARFTAFFSPDLDFLGKSNIDGVLMWRYRNAHL